MPDYDFFLSGNPDDVLFQLVEISHPAWSKVYRIVKNNANGLTVTHENGEVHDYEYVPLTIQKGSSSNDLDQSITIAVGDLGEVFPSEIDAVRSSNEYAKIKPTLNYREYLSSDLGAPHATVLGLLVTDYEPKTEGAVFVCQAEQMNLTKTGEVYTIDNTPTLRGYL